MIILASLAIGYCTVCLLAAVILSGLHSREEGD